MLASAVVCGWGPSFGADRPVDCVVWSADFNADGAVDGKDAAIFAAHFGETERSAWCEGPVGSRHHIGQHVGDTDRDGDVDVHDAAILAREFGGPPDPPIPPIPGVSIRSRCDGGLFVVDAQGDREFVIIDSSTVPQGAGLIWWDYTRPATGLEPSFTIRSRPDGFDLIAEYRNDTAKVRTLGTIRIGGIPFVEGAGVERKFGSGLWERPIESGVTHTFYPSGGLYAPVYLARGRIGARDDLSKTREYLIGISVQYPLLAYRHGVDFWMKRSPDGASCGLDISLNNDNDGSQVMDSHPEGDIHPGEVRVYTISVRIMAVDAAASADGSDASMRLFQEYRRYFKRLYGDVRYTRDPRPVNGYLMAGLAGATAENMGFNPPRLNQAAGTPGVGGARNATRAEGWDAWIERFENAEARGFSRFMLWAPSGVAVNPACTGPSVNYPFQFTSRWRAAAGNDPSNPILRTRDSMRTWAGVVGREVGLWWGNSVRPVPWGTCDAPDVHRLDPCDDGDVSAVDIEMGTAKTETGPYSIGVSAIGLDAFGIVQPDISYVWLRRLRERHPSMRFITEPVCFDVMHTLAPAFVGAYQQNGDGPVECRISGPHVMADFLNKGHETWAHIFQMPSTPDCAGGAWRGSTTQDRLKQLMADLARFGFVPVIAGGPPWEDGDTGEGMAQRATGPMGPNLFDQRDGRAPVDFEAAATWETTVPPDLRD